MPGFTHLQVAQPVTFGHHLLAYCRDARARRERLADCRKRVNRLPLGAAALAGTSFPIDRERVARELGFEGVCENSLDAVSDRDFAIEFCACAALVMVHLSRFAEELVLWMSPRFGFVACPTPSAPARRSCRRRRTPTCPSWCAARPARVVGHLVALLTLMKGQPLAYNKDNQEDKEPLFDTVDTLQRHASRSSPALVAGHRAGAERDARRGARGLRHRDRPRRLPGAQGRAVPRRARGRWRARCARPSGAGVDLAALPLAELQQLLAEIGADVQQVLTLEGSVAARNHLGGTAPAQVRAAVARARKRAARGRRPMTAATASRRSASTRSCASSARARRPRSTCATTRSTVRDVAVKVAFTETLQRSRARQGVPQAVRHRGLARRQAAAPAHLPDLRRGGGRAAALHRDGVRRRRHARAVLPARCAAAVERDRRDRRSSARARSSSRTSWASRTATSSRPTSCSPARPTSRSPTSARR